MISCSICGTGEPRFKGLGSGLVVCSDCLYAVSQLVLRRSRDEVALFWAVRPGVARFAPPHLVSPNWKPPIATPAMAQTHANVARELLAIDEITDSVLLESAVAISMSKMGFGENHPWSIAAEVLLGKAFKKESLDRLRTMVAELKSSSES